jgi:amphi-Trp domain-containing protein
MDLLEIKRRERLPREIAAERLHRLADDLARHNELAFTEGSARVRIPVADEVELEIELEVGDDGVELEIELKWRGEKR